MRVHQGPVVTHSQALALQKRGLQSAVRVRHDLTTSDDTDRSSEGARHIQRPNSPTPEHTWPQFACNNAVRSGHTSSNSSFVTRCRGFLYTIHNFSALHITATLVKSFPQNFSVVLRKRLPTIGWPGQRCICTFMPHAVPQFSKQPYQTLVLSEPRTESDR